MERALKVTLFLTALSSLQFSLSNVSKESAAGGKPGEIRAAARICRKREKLRRMPSLCSLRAFFEFVLHDFLIQRVYIYTSRQWGGDDPFTEGVGFIALYCTCLAFCAFINGPRPENFRLRAHTPPLAAMALRQLACAARCAPHETQLFQG